MGFWRKRSFLLGAAYYCAISLVIISLGSPLFRILGFEYSGFIALFSSIHLLYYSAGLAAEQRSLTSWSSLKKISAPVFILVSIPLLISVISILFIPNCSLFDGIVFYIEIVYLTALIAILCGIRFGLIPRSETRTNTYLTIFWLLTVGISLLPGYFSAKIYTYGWQYGYFPGFVWDEAMELKSPYWISRIVELFLIASWLVYDNWVMRNGTSSKKNIKSIILSWQYWLLTVAVVTAGVIVLNQLTDSSLTMQLNQEIGISNAHIHCRARSLTNDEISLVRFETRKYIKEIDSIYGIKNSSKIDIFIFPSSDDLYEYVGTREASISKPWKSSIYITKQNLHSLKHELVHTIIAKFGSFPLDISWSTGLTEGAAVALENDYDGIRSNDEYAARILQMKLADGVENVMQLSGFLSSAPSQSYVLSGSFSKYLLDCCGADKFLRLYKERDFDNSYSRSLSQLESDWKSRLKKYETPMDHYDSLRTLYYFKRTSILHQPCIRRIGKLIQHADEVFKAKDYANADSLYAIAERESGRLKAIRGRVFSQLHVNNPTAALAILDTTASAKEFNNLAALRILRGDVIALASGDLARASGEWIEAMRSELGDGYFTAAFIRVHLFGGTNTIAGVQKILRDLYDIEEAKDKYGLIFSLEPKGHDDFAFYVSRLYLYVSYFERTGRLSDAYTIWKEGLEQIRFSQTAALLGTPGQELFNKLMAKKFSGYEEVFKDRHSSESKTLP